MTSIPEWTEGVCGDGAAILRDGQMVPIEEVVAELNHNEKRIAALLEPHREADRATVLAVNTCKMCRFFAAKMSRLSPLKMVDGVGECRRNAPRGPVALGWRHQDGTELAHAAVMSAFPFTAEDDWCGEWAFHKVVSP